MGIKLQTKTKLKATQKLYNQISSFLFEQEYDELKHFTPDQRKVLRDASKVLIEVLKNG